MSEAEQLKRGMLVGNVGEPLRLSEVNVSGVSGNAARSGDQVQLITRLAITSDERSFHIIADGLCGVLQHSAQMDGFSINLKRADIILLVIKPNNSAELWIDTAAVSVSVIMKRACRGWVRGF